MKFVETLLRRGRRVLIFTQGGMIRLWIGCLQLIWEPICWAAGRRGSKAFKITRRILFIALDNPGDVLLATPSLTALKERFPSAEITVLVAEWSRELLTANPAVSKVILYNAPWFKPWVAHLAYRPFRPVRDFLQCLRRLWRGRFDLVVETRGEASHILLAYLSGAPERVGYALWSVVDWLRAENVAPLLTRRVPYAWDRWFEWHRVDYNLQVTAALGALPKDSSLVLSIPSSARQYIQNLLEREGVREEDLLIGVQPGASREQKRWPIPYFAKTLDCLVERWNARVVVIGSPQERKLAKDLAAAMVHRPILLAGETSLLEAAALVQRCQLVICNDSLITHVASATKTPVITLSRSPSNFYAPYRTQGIALTHQLPCMNPTLPDSCDCPFSEYLCLQEVTPQEVIEAAENLLSSWGQEERHNDSPSVGIPRRKSTSQSLRIGFDFRSLRRKSRFYGLGTYTRGLFKGLTGLLPRESFSLFLNGDLPPTCDLVHVLDPWPIQNGHGRVLATVHDLIPLIFPKKHLDPSWSRSKTRREYQRYCEVLQKLDCLIAVSHHTKADLQRVLGIPSHKIYVIYEGVDPGFRPVTNLELLRQVRAKYHLPELFVLDVGSCDYRKNIHRLIEAFARFRIRSRWPGQLLLVGEGMRFNQNLIDQWATSCRIREEVRVIPYVPAKDLALLYNAASAFVFPSLYEGFGLPALEAMACGTPVVSSNASSLPEVVGEAAVLVDPVSPESIARGIERVIEDEALQADLRQLGFLRSSTFSWERCAKETLEVYLQIVGKDRERLDVRH